MDYIINPSQPSQNQIQLRGLDPNARDPHNYLKMVSKTFNSFKETSYNNSIVSYIHGFECEYLFIDEGETKNYLSEDEITKYIDTTKKYHLIKINVGACFIDNQYIEFNTPSIFLYEQPSESEPANLLEDLTNPAFDNQKIKLFQNKKYKIIIEYQWINQIPAQTARIKIVPDESTYDYTNSPYLKIASFQIDSNGNLIKNNPEQDSNVNITSDYLKENNLVQVNENNKTLYYKRGIDPQYLSKLYIDNFKKLFQNMQEQMFSVFNEAGLTKSNFTILKPNEVSTGLQTGTMVYLDQNDKTYKPAQSSRQKTDKVVGLYLFDNINNQHLLFFNGLIDLDPDNVLFNMDYKQYKEIDGVLIKQSFSNRYGLTFNHPLINLEVSNYYYLEDDSRYFTDSLLMYNLENYIEWDTRGFISTRKFPGSVKVGYAVDRTKLLLNIDQSNEIDWDHAVDLYGNHKLFQDEFINTLNYYKYDNLIKTITSQKDDLSLELNTFKNYLGSNIHFSQLESYSVITHDIDNNLKVFSPVIADPNNYTKPDYLLFLVWFSNYILKDKLPKFDSKKPELVFTKINNEIVFTEANDNPLVIYFNDTFCNEDTSLQTMYKNSTTNLYDHKKVRDILNTLIVNTINILTNTRTSYNSLKGTKLNQNTLNEFEVLVKKELLNLGDNPDTMDVFEDRTKNIIRDLGIKYTDENITSINYDTNYEANNTAINTSVVTNHTNYESIKTEIKNIDIILSKLEIDILMLKDIKNKLEKLGTLLDNSIYFMENKIITINKEIVGFDQNIVGFNLLKIEADNKRSKFLPLALDIFYLNNYERKRYNYTYLVDRLRYEFELGDTLKADKIISESKLKGLRSSSTATLYDIKLEELNLDRIEKRLIKNTENIKSYTNEINLLHKEFNRTQILLGDKSFNYEDDLINENPDNFRFGVDFGPIGSNDERYIINEAFLQVCTNILFKLKTGGIQKEEIPNRLIPSIYNIEGSGLSTNDFIFNNFKPILFDIMDGVSLEKPYFYLMLDDIKTLCYSYDGKDYIFRTDIPLPNDMVELDYNNIHTLNTNTNGDIIFIDNSFYVYQNKINGFTKLKPEILSNIEITRFVREARVKSISEDLTGIIDHTNFIQYFLQKESILIDTDTLNEYINTINEIEINDYSVELIVVFPVINNKYPELILTTNGYYNNWIINQTKFNELINLRILCNNYNILSDNPLEDNYISDSVLLKYNLMNEFRNESKEVRINKITKLLDFYASLLITIKNDTTLEIKKYRDINILNLVELQNVLNT